MSGRKSFVSIAATLFMAVVVATSPEAAEFKTVAVRDSKNDRDDVSEPIIPPFSDQPSLGVVPDSQPLSANPGEKSRVGNITTSGKIKILTQKIKNTIVIKPEDKATLYEQRGDLYFEIGDYQKARDDYRAAHLYNKTDKLNRKVGNALVAEYKREHKKLTEEDYHKLLQFDPDNEVIIKIHTEQLELINSNLKQLSWMSNSSNSSLVLNYKSIKNRANIHLKKLADKIILGKTTKDIQNILDEKIYPACCTPALHLVLASLAPVDSSLSFEYIDLAIKAGAEIDLLAEYGLAEKHIENNLLKHKKYNEALQEINKLIELYPQDQSKRFLRAKIYYQSGDYTKALDGFDYFIKNGLTREYEAIFYCADIYLKLNKKPMAVAVIYGYIAEIGLGDELAVPPEFDMPAMQSVVKQAKKYKKQLAKLDKEITQLQKEIPVNRSKLAQAFNKKAKNYFSLNKINQAIDMLESALTYADKNKTCLNELFENSKLAFDDKHLPVQLRIDHCDFLIKYITDNKLRAGLAVNKAIFSMDSSEKVSKYLNEALNYDPEVKVDNQLQDVLNAIITSRKNQMLAFKALGFAARDAKDNKAAVVHFTNALEAWEDLETRIECARYNLLLGNLQLALQDRNKIGSAKVDVITQMLFVQIEGENLILDNKDQQAEEVFTRGIKLGSEGKNPVFKLLSGRATARSKLRNYQGAKDDFSKVIDELNKMLEQYRDDVQRLPSIKKLLCNSYRERALFYKAWGQSSLAIKDFEAAIDIDGNDMLSFVGLAMTYDSQNNAEMTKKIIKQIVIKDPNVNFDSPHLEQLRLQVLEELKSWSWQGWAKGAAAVVVGYVFYPWKKKASIAQKEDGNKPQSKKEGQKVGKAYKSPEQLAAEIEAKAKNDANEQKRIDKIKKRDARDEAKAKRLADEEAAIKNAAMAEFKKQKEVADEKLRSDEKQIKKVEKPQFDKLLKNGRAICQELEKQLEPYKGDLDKAVSYKNVKNKNAIENFKAIKAPDSATDVQIWQGCNSDLKLKIQALVDLQEELKPVIAEIEAVRDELAYKQQQDELRQKQLADAKTTAEKAEKAKLDEAEGIKQKNREKADEISKDEQQRDEAYKAKVAEQKKANDEIERQELSEILRKIKYDRKHPNSLNNLSDPKLLEVIVDRIKGSEGNIKEAENIANFQSWALLVNVINFSAAINVVLDRHATIDESLNQGTQVSQYSIPALVWIILRHAFKHVDVKLDTKFTKFISELLIQLEDFVNKKSIMQLNDVANWIKSQDFFIDIKKQLKQKTKPTIAEHLEYVRTVMIPQIMEFVAKNKSILNEDAAKALIMRAVEPFDKSWQKQLANAQKNQPLIKAILHARRTIYGSVGHKLPKQQVDAQWLEQAFKLFAEVETKISVSAQPFVAVAAGGSGGLPALGVPFVVPVVVSDHKIQSPTVAISQPAAGAAAIASGVTVVASRQNITNNAM